MSELEQVVYRGDRGRFWFLAAIGALCLVIAGLTGYAVYVNVKQGKAIAKVESPCLKYGPDSKQCEEAFSAAVSTITHPQACAIERKAGTLRAIRELADDIGVDFTEPCAGARIAQERERRSDRAAAAEPTGSIGGGALQTGSTGHQQPGPRGGGGDKAGPAGSEPSAEAPSASDPRGAAPNSNPPPRADSPAAALSPPGLIEQTTGAAAGVVDQAGEDVQQTVDNATCNPLVSLCPPH